MPTQVKVIPRNGFFVESFDVMVPRSIQGKPCILIHPAKAASLRRGTVSALISVEGKSYSVPAWAVEEIDEQELVTEFFI